MAIDKEAPMTTSNRRSMFRLAVRAGIAGLGSLIAAGCAGPALTRVHDPAQRFAGPGFSIGVPPGAEWYIVPPAPGRVQFAKRVGTEPVPTILAAAWAADVDARPARAEELVRYKQRSVERLQRVETAYVITLTEVEVDRTLGGECIRWVQQEEERNHPSPALRGLVLLTTTRGVDCLHPANPRRIVTAGYSERRVKASPSLVAWGQPIAEEGDAFLRSLRLTTPP
jgi:hypothetical protein